MVKKKSFNFSRIRFLLWVIFAIFGILILRLFYWQVLNYSTLSTQADEQHWKSEKLSVPRGNIYSSDGAVLVGNIPAYDLILDRTILNKPEKEIIGKVLDIAVNKEDEASESARLEKLLSNPKATWIKLFSRLDVSVKKEIDAEEYKGLIWKLNMKRYYPEASTAAHLLGFVADNSAGSPQGYFGLEGYYNRELTGKQGKEKLETDAIGNPIVFGQKIEEASLPGRDLLTHIDRTIQVITDQKLKNALSKYEAVAGTVTIMDPKTGAVLAMSSFPNYDPEKINDVPKNYYLNPIINQSFEPGSTFKVLVMAAAINEGLVDDETRCPCKGPAVVSGYSISTWNGVFHPNSSISDIIQHSDNVGMVFVSQQFHPSVLVKYIRDFGFGEATRVDLQDESVSSLRKKWRKIDLATASFGQGIAVTPLQMVTAVSSLANDGWLMQPEVVDKILIKNPKSGVDDIDMEMIQIKPKRVRQVVSADTAHKITNIMIKAVEYGEAKWAAPKGYSIAGKTGTAQIPVAGHYDETKTIASFVGFAPADDPKFAMLVTLREPKTSPWGSETAAPLWFDIAKQLFLHWNIPPNN